MNESFPPAQSARPFLIGVAGGTCSGKTTVSERLSELAGGEHLALIKLDSYYVDRAEQAIEQRAAANYDHPDAFDWQLLNDHLAALAAGASVPVPVYDYGQPHPRGSGANGPSGADHRGRGHPRALRAATA